MADSIKSTRSQFAVSIDIPPALLGDSTFRLLVNQITDYAIFLLTPNGEVATWNPGAERIKGFKPQDIIGKHFRIFYSPEEQAAHKPEYELQVASLVGRFEDEGWRIRKDGSRFWANVIITAIHDSEGALLGFGKVTRDLTERRLAEEQLRELSTRVLRMQDEERGRLGRELHDSIGQYLVAAKMPLDALTSDPRFQQNELHQNVADALELIDRAIREVRTLSYLLYPPMLEETGLSTAIRWHLEGFSKRSGIKTTYESAHDFRLPREIELAFFRVLQESLTNVHRHSQSNTAHIRFAVEYGEAVLEITDHGRGIAANPGSPKTLGVGIRGMEARIRQLGGKLDIRSSSEGTTVRARVPVDVSTYMEDS